MAITAAQRELIVKVTEQKQGDALTSVANDLTKLGHGMDATSDKTKEFTEDSKRLNAEIEKSTARVKDLHKQFAATGDASLFGDIRKEESNLRNLQKTFRALTPDFQKAGVDLGETLGLSVTNSFSKQLSGAFSGGGGGAGGAAIGGAVLGLLPALVPIGAIVAGLVAGTVGTGGVIGGVLAATHDPRVKSAFSSFASDIQGEFFSSGGSFVDPIRRSLLLLEDDVKGLHLSDTFALAAPDLEIIVKGLGDLVKNVMPGLNTLLARSGPFAKAAAAGFADMGSAISELFDSVSQNRGSLEGLNFTFKVLNETLRFIGLNLKGASIAFHLGNTAITEVLTGLDNLTSKFGVVIPIIDKTAGEFQRLTGLTTDTSDGTLAVTSAIGGAITVFDGYSGSLDEAAHHAKALADEITAANEAIDKNITLATDAWGATLNLAQGYLDLQDAINKGATGWDANTKAGHDNQEMIRNQIIAAQHARDAQIALGDGTEESSNKAIAAYDAELKKILLYAQALGATKAQLDAIAKTYYASLIITIQEKSQISKANAVDRALSNLLGFAEGGTVPGPIGSAHLAVVHGGEKVLTPPQAAAMSAPSAGDGAAMAMMFGGNLDSAFATYVMKLVRSGDITITSKAIVQ